MIRGQSSKNGLIDFAPTNDKMVLIQRGEILTGQFTKAIVGSSSGGLIHLIFSERGPMATKDFLTSAQYIICQWLLEKGHTVGIEDAMPMKQVTM